MPRIPKEMDDQFRQRVYARYADDADIQTLQVTIRNATKALQARKSSIIQEEKSLLGIPERTITNFEACEYETMHGIH